MLCRIRFWVQVAAQLNLLQAAQSRAGAANSKPGLPSRGCCRRSSQTVSAASQGFSASTITVPLSKAELLPEFLPLA